MPRDPVAEVARLPMVMQGNPVLRIKICGVTNVEDAAAAARAGAQAVGLNFYAQSPRSVTIGEAIEIAAALPGDVARVGVFVNAGVEQILETVERVGLDYVQLHGDEPAEVVAQLAGRGVLVIKAFRCGEEGLRPAADFLTQCEKLGCMPDAVLIDAQAPGAYGGTGKVVDWNTLRPQNGKLGRCPILLAGGLTPENVAEAIRTARPWGVDTASGVESSPGKKDSKKMRAFVAAAHRQLADDSNVESR